MSSSAVKGADTARVKGVSSDTDTSTVGDDLVASAGITVSVAVQELIVLALADTHRALDGLSLGADTGIAVVDHGSGANSAYSIDDESVGKRRARGADIGRVKGESTLADALSTNKNLVVGADVAA